MGERGPKSQFTNISCTNPKCRLYEKAGEGNIVGNGTYMACGQISQKYICRECGHYFNSRTDTAYGGLRSEADKFDLAIKCINEGMGVRATARTVGCSVSTVQRWTLGAAAQAAAVSGSFERNLEPAGMQFDEMSGTLKKTEIWRGAVHLRRIVDLDVHGSVQQIPSGDASGRMRDRGRT